MTAVPVIDLARYTAGSDADRRELAREVDAACRDIGFLGVTGHGVDPAVIRNAWDQARAFFDLNNAAKAAVAPPCAGYPYGYFAPEAESLARSRGDESLPDLKESFNIGPLERPAGLRDSKNVEFCYAPNLWPDEPAGFRKACIDYYKAMSELAATLMEVLALALELPADYFKPSTGACISAMRLLNYPALDDAPPKGQLRAGAHSDYGSLTILLPDPASAGLEVETRHDGWQPADAAPGDFIVNLGDLMARWTNDRWVSTLHRVVTGKARRQSIAFFQQPDWDAEISCIPTCLGDGEAPRYEPVHSGPYLMSRFQRTVEARA